MVVVRGCGEEGMRSDGYWGGVSFGGDEMIWNLMVKNAIREAILDGIIGNNFEEAYAYMKKIGEEQGLTIVKEIEAPVVANNSGPVPQKPDNA